MKLSGRKLTTINWKVFRLC